MLGNGNRIVACNRYLKLFYNFSIFEIPTNIPLNSLDVTGLLQKKLYTFGTKQTLSAFS